MLKGAQWGAFFLFNHSFSNNIIYKHKKGGDVRLILFQIA